MHELSSITELADKVAENHKLHSSSKVFTVAISGIDASGKGHIGKLLQKKIECNGLNVANINIDPWQHQLAMRLQKENAAQNVYNNIFRWNDFFEQLIFPLQKNKSIYLETLGIHTHSDEYYHLIYDFKNIDILLIEGIFLFKKKYLSYYDYKIWIECSFEKGLQRAMRRNAEKLDEESLIHDYHTFYYPAQLLHFEKDNPRESVNIVFDNN